MRNISNKKKFKTLFIGNYGKKSLFKGSQTKKTISIHDFLSKNNIHIKKFNTAKINKFFFPYYLIKLIWEVITSKNILISLNKNGLKFYNFLFLKIVTFFPNKKLYFISIGGWIASFIQKNKKTLKYFSSFEVIYVQAEEIKRDLNTLGLYNVENMKNFRAFDLNILQKFENRIESLNYVDKNTINLLFFASIKEGKGLEIILESVEKYVENYNDINFTLDIIGPVRPEYKERFNELISKYSYLCNYKGIINDQEKIYEILNSYDFLVFPTYYEGEGFPTVVVESFIAGLPVLASDWKYNREVIKEEYNGLLFETNNIEELVEKLDWLANNREKIKKFRLNCLYDSKNYHEEIILSLILKRLSIKN